MARHVPMHEMRALMGHTSIGTAELYYLAAGDSLPERVESAFGSSAALTG